MIATKQLAFLVAAVAIALPLDAQSPPLPIIDMHMHALEADAQGPPPMGMCPGEIAGFPVMEPGRHWPDTFMGVSRNRRARGRSGRRRPRAS